MEKPNFTDEELIIRFQKGDETAFTELVNRYKDKILNFIYRYVGDIDLANDLAQDTF